MPTWKEGRGPESQWAGLHYELDDAEETGSIHIEEPGPRPRLEEEEDSITLLDESEALELVEFDPKVKPAGTWEPPQTIRNFLEKHFNKSLSEGERESILKDFPKPNVDDAVVTTKLGGDAVEEQGEEPSLRYPLPHAETAA